MHEGLGKIQLFILYLLLTLTLGAQEITINGGFIEDSLLIGQKVNYWVTATYPPTMEMVFPDSNASFSPFEYASKTYFSTQLIEGSAFDSTVYTLQSFEIDPVQYLSLDAIILQSNDSTVVKTPLDSIYLNELAPMVTDSTRLKTNLDYQNVGTQFNYPLLYYILGGVVVLVIILLLVFGKKIIRYFRLQKLKKEHREFSEAFSAYIAKLKEGVDIVTAEKALTLWKKYQERLDKKAFSSFTTKEILKLDFTQELESPLKSIDRVVYGKRIQANVYQDFQQIEDFAKDRYFKKAVEIKNGK